jgi:glyoxylase-like metal-dependent hydrolase (beta-lactamase superfamily II)
MKSNRFYLFLLICIIHLGCSNSESFKVIREVTGPYQTNCYLIYGTSSREAALIDPGWQIDTLVAFIKDNNLFLKYILITHGHSDHYYYVPELKKQFPKVKWGVNIEDFEKIILCPDWSEKAYGKDWFENTRMNADENVYLDFDTKTVGKPDFFVKGDQTYKLGSVKIKTIHTPGHSPGGVCYYTGNVLFSGDMLFYRSVGNLDFLTSNTDAFIKSVRSLYRLFPDSTIVYPGHNQPTDIGSEKIFNQRISLTGSLKTWWHLH